MLRSPWKITPQGRPKARLCCPKLRQVTGSRRAQKPVNSVQDFYSLAAISGFDLIWAGRSADGKHRFQSNHDPVHAFAIVDEENDVFQALSRFNFINYADSY
jgi:hypothetical protein